MLGPEGAAALTTAWLLERLPVQLAALRSRLNVPADHLPDPGVVLPYDRLRLGVEQWPAVGVEVLELRALTRLDVVDVRELYAGRYATRLVLWTRGEQQDDTDLLRKRYALAVRECLLVRRVLSDQPPASGIAVDPLTIRESYGPPLTDDAGATILGAYLLADVIVREDLEVATALGLQATTELDTAPLPHPANL